MSIHEIHSKSSIRRGNILHKIVRFDDFPEEGREDLSDNHAPLQVAMITAPPEKEFKAHRHLLKEQDTQARTQEAWVVIRGCVEVDYYDTDDKLLETHTLLPGDCSVTYAGGHAYRMTKHGAKVYEFKTGPYHGQTEDKVFIG
jgi:mannose-6-phosphate isomerase-like protein (cupin superfamily)